MQFAINIFIFVFGFGLASLVGAKPKQLRASLDSLMTNLRYVLDAFRPGAASTTEQFEKHLVAQESPELLTRSVAFLRVIMPPLVDLSLDHKSKAASVKTHGNARHMTASPKS